MWIFTRSEGVKTFSITLFVCLCLLGSLWGQSEPQDLQRVWQGIPGLERTPQGRVYVSWFSGGRQEPALENTVYLSYSDDGGQSYTAPRPMAGPRDMARAFDPTLWIDPKGRLWYFFNRGSAERGVHDVHARICEQPDAAVPQWSAEFKLDLGAVPYAFRMNKPTVLRSGAWVLPVTHAQREVRGWFGGDSQLQGVAISSDEGRTWKLHGALKAPAWALECMIVELKDGRLWLLTRTGDGVLWQSYSADQGLTWSDIAPSTIKNPGSRFYIRRLASGNLLLVNHHQFTGRSHLTAQVSQDEGQSWSDGLLLDERTGVSYPDGVQDRDGLIWITYDYQRHGPGEIVVAKFREEDAMAGKDVSGQVHLRQVIHRLPGSAESVAQGQKLLPGDWDAKVAADGVMARLINVTTPQVKGAHDAEMVMVGNRTYIVAEANDERVGENAAWPFVYVTLTVVNHHTMKVEKQISFARGEQVFENATLEVGACFVPRILQLNDKTLRCYFASESPGKRQSVTWYRDFDLSSQAFATTIHPVKLKTAAGMVPMEPQHFYQDAAAQGFSRPPVDFGLYIFDSFKKFDGQLYVALNNYPGGQNALARVNAERDTFEVIGHYNEPNTLKLTESAVNRLPDGTWMAICRQEGGNKNYTFTTSQDGKTWTTNEYRDFVPNGDSSKPTFDKFNNVYYLGWQESTRIGGVSRSVFNLDVSADGQHWERRYRFETDQSFQYPTFRLHQGSIYLTVTQGDGKQRIMFGKLE